MPPGSQPSICPCCTLAQTKQYCQRCLQSGLASHSNALSTLQSQLAISIKRCTHLLHGDANGRTGLEKWGIVRAGVAERRRVVEEFKEQIGKREQEITASKARIKVLGATFADRRRNITIVSSINERQDLDTALASISTRQADITQRLIHARTVLVNEAIDVFSVRQRSDNRSWEIAKLELPSIGSLKNHPSSEINAALMHTLHLLSLLTTYLSISLPFEPTPCPPHHLAHVGRPIIKASTPFLGTTRWREKYILWMSSTAASLSTSSRKRQKSKVEQSLADLSIFALASDSSPAPGHGHGQAQMVSSNALAKTWAKHRHFLTAFALLAHSVAYLAWTQGVEGIGLQETNSNASVPSAAAEDENDDEPQRSRSITPLAGASANLISPTDILHLIQLISLSPSLGRRSHEPGAGPSLALRHLGFGLDVAKVVQSVWDAEGAGAGRVEADVGEGWDLLERE